MNASDIRDWLMGYDEYKKEIWTKPYYYILKRSGTTLYYFGAQHTREINHPQFELLNTFWKKFLEFEDCATAIVLVEGSIKPALSAAKAAIRTYGESGYMCFHAKRAKIPVFTPEPSYQQQVDYLREKFLDEIVQYYLFSRYLYRYPFENSVEKVKVYLKKRIENEKERYDWGKAEFTLEKMECVHRRIFENEIDYLNKNFFYDIQLPFEESTIINLCSRENSIYRDVHIIQQIEGFLRQKKMFLSCMVLLMQLFKSQCWWKCVIEIRHPEGIYIPSGSLN